MPDEVIGPCAECRFWKVPGVPLTSLPPEWRECQRANDGYDLNRRIYFNSQGWDCDGGAIVTRADFGCIQWEQK